MMTIPPPPLPHHSTHGHGRRARILEGSGRVENIVYVIDIFAVIFTFVVNMLSFLTLY